MDYMNIANLATSMAQENIMSKVSVAVLSDALDTARSDGAQLTNMINASSMELSVNPNIGSMIDISV